VHEAGGAQVQVRTIQVDAASPQLGDLLSDVDLVWASRVVHHLPDQRKGIEGLVGLLTRAGGWPSPRVGSTPVASLGSRDR